MANEGAPFELIVADLKGATAAIAERKGGLASRVVRGRKMQDRAGVFDEFAAALQFPLYFGENWDALQDCLRDPYPMWEPGVLIAVLEPELVLVNDPAALPILIACLSTAAADLALPSETAGVGNRPSVELRVALLASDGRQADIRSRWGVPAN